MVPTARANEKPNLPPPPAGAVHRCDDACGIYYDPHCPIWAQAEAKLLARYPALAKPGPQPHNQIGTLREQLELAHTPRQTAHAALVELIEATVRRVLVDELPSAVSYLLQQREGPNNAA